MRYLLGGSEAGTARITQKVEAGGSKTVELRLQATLRDDKLTVVQFSRYDARGNPVRRTQELTDRNGRRQIVATFDPSGATVVSIVNGARTTRKVPVPAGRSMANPSEFWYLRGSAPKAGTTVRFVQFNLDNLEWEETTAKAVGEKVVVVAGRRVRTQGIELTSQGRTIRAFVDDSGMPVLLDAGRIQFLRAIP